MLVESWEDGVVLSSDGDYQRETFLINGMDIFMRMLWRDGFMHADLHTGNIIMRDDLLVLLDTGLTTRLNRNQVRVFAQLLVDIVAGDGRSAAELLTVFDTNDVDVDREPFKKEMDELFKREAVYVAQDKNLDLSMLMNNMARIIQRHRLELKSEFASCMIVVGVLEGVAKHINPDIDIIQTAIPHFLNHGGEDIVKDRVARYGGMDHFYEKLGLA